MTANQPTVQQAAARGATPRRIRLYTFLPVALATAVAVALAALGLYLASEHGDQIGVERLVRETRRAIKSTRDALAVDQEAVALWNDLILALRKMPPDLDWVHTNIGAYLNNLFKHDRVYVLSPANAPLYAEVDGAQVEPTIYADVAGNLAHLVETVRGRLPDRNNPRERLPGVPLHPLSTARTSERAIQATEVVTIFGRPAAASVIRIMPYTNDVGTDAPGQERLLVSVRFLDGTFPEEFCRARDRDCPRMRRRSAAHRAGGDRGSPSRRHRGH